jgi:hypothetical protein
VHLNTASISVSIGHVYFVELCDGGYSVQVKNAVKVACSAARIS